MTIELGYYIFLSLITLVFALTNFSIKNFKVLTISLLIIYSIIIRFSGFDIDMQVYAERLSYPLPYLLVDFYYYREWFYWFGSILVYQVVQLEEIVFIMYDIMAIFAVYYSFRKFDLPLYSIFLFFLFFPSLMGLQNVYRQFLSSAFMLYALSYSGEKNIRKYIFFLLAGFCHNVAFLFLPLLFLRKKLSYLFFFSCFFSCIMLVVSSDTKSFTETGLDLAFFYPIILILLFFFFTLSNQFKFLGEEKRHLYINYFLFFLLLIAINILGSSQVERLGMFELQLIFPFMCSTIEKKYKGKELLRVFLILVLLLPTFLFSSAFNMLMTLK